MPCRHARTVDEVDPPQTGGCVGALKVMSTGEVRRSRGPSTVVQAVKTWRTCVRDLSFASSAEVLRGLCREGSRVPEKPGEGKVVQPRVVVAIHRSHPRRYRQFGWVDMWCGRDEDERTSLDRIRHGLLAVGLNVRHDGSFLSWC